MSRCRAIVVALAAVVLATGRSDADVLQAAERTGSRLPEPRRLALALDALGAYVPEVAGLATGDTALLQGNLTWNLALSPSIGLFGLHQISGMWWGDVTMLTLGNEAGLRWLATDRFVMEAAYLGHRGEQEWIEREDGSSLGVALGGVRDHGGEIGSWLSFRPLAAIGAEAHLFGRIFRVYEDTQGVAGLGARVSVSVASGQVVILDLTGLEVIRGRPRPGVDKSTLNLVGRARWRIEIADGTGIQIGAIASTNMLCGEAPMLELKRSMIDEPMVVAMVGAYTEI